MAMLRGAPLKGACLRTAPQIREPRSPKLSPDQPQKIRHGLWISRGFSERHGKHLIMRKADLLASRGNALCEAKPTSGHVSASAAHSVLLPVGIR
jgi:hypothetical protein